MEGVDDAPAWLRPDPAEELARVRLLDLAERAGWLAVAAAAAAPSALFGTWAAIEIAQVGHVLPRLVWVFGVGATGLGGLALLALGGRHAIRAVDWGSVGSAAAGLRWACVGAMTASAPALAALGLASQAPVRAAGGGDVRFAALAACAPFILLAGSVGVLALVASRRMRTLAGDPVGRAGLETWRRDPVERVLLGGFAVVLTLTLNVLYLALVGTLA